MKRFFVLVIVISIAFGCFYFWSLKANESENKSTNVVTEIAKSIEEADLPKSEKQENKIIAVWLTYSEIGSLVKGKSEAEYKDRIGEVLSDLKANKINTVFYQCRAFCDSFYQSEIFPVSKYIVAQSIEPAYDPFEIFLEKAKAYGVSVHCWINPYRVSYDDELDNLPENSPARKIYKANKTSLIICESGIFLNPASNEARSLVLSGIKEILKSYKVSGFHFDDYFYPEAEKINDGKLYKEYKAKGGNLSLEDWRRENVNALVSSVYSLVKAENENLMFSISPSADIEKCKNSFYADVEKWCREEGFVDALIPQIYYGFENEKMPFTDVMRKWENIASKSSVKLVCGLAPYKCGKIDEFAGDGKTEWTQNVNILSRQYEQIQKNPVWQGFSLFSYSYCFGENVGENSKKEIKKLLDMVE